MNENDSKNTNKLVIRYVRERPELWDLSHETYKDNHMKRLAWIEISNNINLPEKFVKTRWRSLRDRYHKEVKNNCPLGKNPWYLMPRLSFLKSTITLSRPRSPKHILKIEPLQSEDEDYGGDFDWPIEEEKYSVIDNPDPRSGSLSPDPLRATYSPEKDSPEPLPTGSNPAPETSNSSLFEPHQSLILAGEKSRYTQIKPLKRLRSIRPKPILPESDTIKARPEINAVNIAGEPAINPFNELTSNQLYFLSVARDAETLSHSSLLRLKSLILNFFLKQNYGTR